MARHRERGTSLIESLLATAILGSCLVAIAGLFVHGLHGLVAGWNATTAVSVARSVLEETNGWPFRRTWEELGFDGASSEYTVDTGSHPVAARWQEALDDRLTGASATIRIESLAGSENPPPLRTASMLRVTVTVFWSERRRPRAVRLVSTRV